MKSTKQYRSFNHILFGLHWGVILLVLGIACGGFAMLYSAAGGEMQPWARNQIIRFIPGFMMMIGIAFIPLRWVMHAAYPFLIFCIALLIGVEVMGHIGMGAQRWVAIGSINLQPSEITKIAVILALARYFHSANPDSLISPVFLMPPLAMLLIPAALIYLQPNLGTATVLVTIGVCIFFIAGVPWRYFIGLGGLAAIIAPIGWHFLHDYQRQRVMTFLDPEKDPLGAGYNVLQSMIAIGSGGLSGKGFLNGSQGQLDFLPEKQTDFIFTMLAEETGFVGGSALLIAYSLLIMCCYRIALMSNHRFGSYVAIGMGTMLFLHLFINVGMSMGILPVVGVPLPLFSYGGSIMIAILLGFGLLLNVWNHRNVSPEKHSINIRGAR